MGHLPHASYTNLKSNIMSEKIKELQETLTVYQRDFDKAFNELQKLKKEVAWWRDYGYYVSETHYNVNEKACEWAYNNDEDKYYPNSC